MVGTSSEGTCGEMGMTLAWNTAESDKGTKNPARRKTGDETKEECAAATVAHD